MTAVEALLQRAADVRRFFDEMLGPIPELPNLGFVADAARDLRRYCRPRREPATDVLAIEEVGWLVEPFYRQLFTPERWRAICRWGSDDAMLIAASRGVAEELNGRWDVRTLEHYLTFLEERERLLDPESLESLAGGAVRESIAWGPDAPEARQRAEAVVESLRRLAQRDVNTRERWQEERGSCLEPAARALGRFALPPVAPDDPARNGESVANAETEAMERASEIAPGWALWADEYDGPGRAEKCRYWAAMNYGVPPTNEELNALKTAIDTIRKSRNRSLAKKPSAVSRPRRT
jgi:hypothetical protein